MPLPRADLLHTALWAAAGVGLLVLLWLLGPILTPFVVAAVFAYLCDPTVNWLVARRWPRPLAVLLVICAAGAAIMLLLLILVPLFWREVAALIARLPEFLDIIDARLLPVINEYLGTSLKLDLESVRKVFSENREQAGDLMPALLGHVREGGMALIGVATNLILIPIVMFYLLQEWPRIIPALQNAIPRPALARTTRIARDIDKVLSEFLRGQLSVMLVLAAFYSIGLWIAGLSFALPVGIITGLLSFIPFVGFGGGLILAILTALLQGDGLPLLIGVGIVYGLGQLLESYALTPYLVGERIGLHPLAVIFALMAFGQLFGFVGMLVALPVSAAILVGLREVRGAWLQSPLYLGAEGAAPPPLYVSNKDEADRTE
ncbi:MAG: AI-2E family transporter [Zoogloeaceae bacterium]|nr:AI-2E family transporter [Zoogloeaceae bacterium]